MKKITVIFKILATFYGRHIIGDILNTPTDRIFTDDRQTDRPSTQHNSAFFKIDRNALNSVDNR